MAAQKIKLVEEENPVCVNYRIDRTNKERPQVGRMQKTWGERLE
jgi:hypothetical protein